jgi:hypothetical protein
MRTARLLRLMILAVAVSAAGLYGGDALWFRQRLAHPAPGSPLDEVTYYVATALKNGKLEFFYDQPQTEICGHAIFPHGGYRPCWYAKRHTVRRVW